MTLDYRIFKTLIKNCEHFENKPHIAVGVSGGPDSMALAFLLNKWIKYKNGKLSAIVFDHGIRHDSIIESFKVKKMLTDLGIDSLIIKPNKNKIIKKNMSNARYNRFEGMIKICKKKRIGPARIDDNRPLFYKKDISLLARNGFDFETSKKVMDIKKEDYVKIIKLL